jgi:hypothetical protein
MSRIQLNAGRGFISGGFFKLAAGASPLQFSTVVFWPVWIKVIASPSMGLSTD